MINNSEPCCDRCDGAGGALTYKNQAVLPINGRAVCIDWCIHHLVAALNAGGLITVASCCGHGKKPGRIDLEDGRVLMVHSEEAYDVIRALMDQREQDDKVIKELRRRNKDLALQLLALEGQLSEDL